MLLQSLKHCIWSKEVAQQQKFRAWGFFNPCLMQLSICFFVEVNSSAARNESLQNLPYEEDI